MAEIVIYSSGACPYCSRAKRLLENKGKPYTEIRVDKERGMREEMEDRSGRTSVPQVFIDGRHIGGYDDMADLDARGDLDPLLA
ncbi:MAG: glutaredoxin 3 [Gammaproteobacteria bacterium]